jgi:TPR repeat protein
VVANEGDARAEERELRIEHARTLFDTDSYNEIIGIVSRPDLQDHDDAIYLLVLALGNLGDTELAIAAVERLIERGDARGAAEMGWLLWKADTFDEALVWYERAAAEGDIEASFLHIRGLLRLGRIDEAEERVHLLVDLPGDVGDEASGILGAIQARRDGVDRQTLSLLERGHHLDGEARAHLGAWHLKRGETRRGLELLNSALKDGSLDASIKLGNYYTDIGEPKKAEKVYRPGADSGDILVIYNLGKLLFENYPRRRREALQLITTAARGGDDVAKSWIRGHLKRPHAKD